MYVFELCIQKNTHIIMHLIIISYHDNNHHRNDGFGELRFCIIHNQFYFWFPLWTNGECFHVVLIATDCLSHMIGAYIYIKTKKNVHITMNTIQLLMQKGLGF